MAWRHLRLPQTQGLKLPWGRNCILGSLRGQIVAMDCCCQGDTPGGRREGSGLHCSWSNLNGYCLLYNSFTIELGQIFKVPASAEAFGGKCHGLLFHIYVAFSPSSQLAGVIHSLFHFCLKLAVTSISALRLTAPLSWELLQHFLICLVFTDILFIKVNFEWKAPIF